MLDRWMIDKADGVIGTMQERGVPLPQILHQAGMAMIAANLLFVGWHVGVAPLLGDPAFQSTFTGIVIALGGLADWRRVAGYRHDYKTMDVKAVQERYRSAALREREAVFPRTCRWLFLLLVPVGIILAALILAGAATGGAVVTMLVIAATLADAYAQCAFPRNPNQHARQVNIAMEGAS